MAAENERHALGFGQGGDGGIDGVPEFGLQYFGVRLAVRAVLDQVVGVFLPFVGGHRFFSSAAAGFVENEVAGDGEEVGGEFRVRAVAFGIAPDAEEDLLGDIFGIAGVAEHFGDGADHDVLVALDEGAERRVVTRADALHQRMVEGVFIGSDWCEGFLHG